MKALIEVRPTAEQLALFSRIRPGVEIIRGAAGSGKTTTALLKLKSAVGFYVNRAKRTTEKQNINVLVLTFNRTLRGYIKELAEQQLQNDENVSLNISTFTSWASGLLNNPAMIEKTDFESLIAALGKNIALSDEFIIDELNYILGKFPTDSLNDYLTARRDGRGATPRMEKPLRELLLNEVVTPYIAHKKIERLVDYHDLASIVATKKIAAYDVVVVDETQDFSANEIRAIMNQLSQEHTTTFVLDTTQRIYTRSSFSWQDVRLLAGLTLSD